MNTHNDLLYLFLIFIAIFFLRIIPECPCCRRWQLIAATYKIKSGVMLRMYNFFINQISSACKTLYRLRTDSDSGTMFHHGNHRGYRIIIAEDLSLFRYFVKPCLLYTSHRCHPAFYRSRHPEKYQYRKHRKHKRKHCLTMQGKRYCKAHIQRT